MLKNVDISDSSNEKLIHCLLAYCMDALAAQMAVTSALHLTRFPAAKGRTPHEKKIIHVPMIFLPK